MGSFKNFLLEEENVEPELTSGELLQLINDELADMDEDEIFAFAYALYYAFFDDEENPEDDYVDFNIDDVNEMIAALGEEFYVDILDLLLPDDTADDFDWSEIGLDDEETPEDTNEAVSRVMRRKNFNRKKRKFFKKSKAELRRGFSARRRANRKNQAKRKRFYRVNKKRIASYQKSRSNAIRKGRHFSKVRRGA